METRSFIRYRCNVTLQVHYQCIIYQPKSPSIPASSTSNYNASKEKKTMISKLKFTFQSYNGYYFKITCKTRDISRWRRGYEVITGLKTQGWLANCSVIYLSLFHLLKILLCFPSRTHIQRKKLNFEGLNNIQDAII